VYIRNLPESVEKYSLLSKLAQDFTYAAMLYSKLIISEVSRISSLLINQLVLPHELKTIKPDIQMGGIAGGSKYKCHGILFKVGLLVVEVYPVCAR
jgi:hypothetical protein